VGQLPAITKWLHGWPGFHRFEDRPFHERVADLSRLEVQCRANLPSTLDTNWQRAFSGFSVENGFDDFD